MSGQDSEIWPAFPPRDDQVLRALGILASVILLLLFLASTVSSGKPSLIAYTAISFSGDSVPLTATSGRCNSLPVSSPAKSVSSPAKSVKNDSDLHATFFAGSDCADPISVVAPGAEDAGFAPANSSQGAFNEPALSLLGAKGALSYRTIALKRE